MIFSQYIKQIGISLFIVLVLWIDKQPVTKISVPKSKVEISDTRESITFILGVDKDDENLYYAEAEKYYRTNITGRTEYIITTCYSLLEASNYLVSYPPSNDQPWGTINLVSHGNQWLGLSVKVTPGGNRTTVETLKKGLKEEVFRSIPSDIIDRKTELIMHGCGVGHNKELMELIGKAFSSETEKPTVKASLLFENYASEYDDNYQVQSQRYYSKAWFAYYKRGYRPGDIRLTRQFNKRYPEAEIDWRDILTREKPRWPGDSYCYTFHVPVKWIVTYPDEEYLPDISTEENRQFWLLEQDKLLSTIEKTQIPFNKFSWRIKAIKYERDDGILVPGIRAKGYATVLCVVVPVMFENDTVVPKTSNKNYFYVSNGCVIDTPITTGSEGITSHYALSR